MLKINKLAQEPPEVSAWKALVNDDWQPSYGNLMGQERRVLRQSLLTEQGHVCCYCNRRIMESPSVENIAEFHIEHFRPQHAFGHLELEYQNVHASCFKNDSPNGRRHCGPAKDDWFDEELTLSPLHDNSGSIRFLYDGSISGLDQAANETIKRLRLDHPMLEAEREAHIAGKLDTEFLLQATVEDLLHLYQAHQQMQNGKYQPFALAVMQRIKELLPAPDQQVL
ncbi:retron system putative HNH endonuclease [Rheinheimera sp. MM224]|uniref:retron system putative HNH endonuclease n=1 Tax=Rheinheimera sp. MM224 TaxID=3019969 RepID=UPI0021F90E6C|nr:retron system putative HNH endonuclease [Rheinheimera sp. MM224]CAI3798178.1 hypothetical protein JAMGFMIE_02006 [Rheinheimera sp. MM224]